MKRFASLSHNKRDIFIAATAIALALSISIAYANVFVYMPIEVKLEPVAPPVYFEYGSNAGNPDLGSNNVIMVSLGSSKESLTVTIHPTYEVSYYKNVSIIVNTDNKVYYISFKVEEPAILPPGSILYLCVYESNAPRKLWTSPANPRPIPVDVLCIYLLPYYANVAYEHIIYPNSKLELDVYVYIPQGAPLPSQTSSKIHLIYTPTYEEPGG
ncbi:MAG: hypothetical protein QXI64_00700 [Sulfolobales archaeon]